MNCRLGKTDGGNGTRRIDGNMQSRPQSNKPSKQDASSGHVVIFLDLAAAVPKAQLTPHTVRGDARHLDWSISQALYTPPTSNLRTIAHCAPEQFARTITNRSGQCKQRSTLDHQDAGPHTTRRTHDRRRRIGGWQAMRRLHGDGAGRGDGGRAGGGRSTARVLTVVVKLLLDLFWIFKW